MDFLNVNRKKCSGDGACVQVCPIKILFMDKRTGSPAMIDKGPEICIRCGHCVAVCPHAALSIEGMAPQDCPEVQLHWRIPPAQLEHFLKARRSIRVYKREAVDKAVIETLIDTARYAPSGINRQPVRWAVIYDAAKVKAFAELTVQWMREEVAQATALAGSLRMERIVAAWEKGEDRICRGAPHLIIAYALKDDMTAAQAATIALTYLELEAAAFGLGACWAGYAALAINRDKRVRSFIGLSSKTDCFGAMLVGYPRFDYRRIPGRNNPRVIWR